MAFENDSENVGGNSAAWWSDMSDRQFVLLGKNSPQGLMALRWQHHLRYMH